MNMTTVRRSLAAVALLAISALPIATASDAAATHQTGTTIALGREGGNIRPFTITIDASGAVQTSGSAQSHGATRVSKDAVKGLLKLAKAEHFSQLPAHIVGTHVLPDFASLYITITTSAGATTVTERGTHNAHFDQLFAVLMAVAGVTF